MHTLVGAGAVGRGGGGGGGLDISNLIKPALARGELQCIGATTLDEHRKHIEKDQALERWAGRLCCCQNAGGLTFWVPGRCTALSRGSRLATPAAVHHRLIRARGVPDGA